MAGIMTTTRTTGGEAFLQALEAMDAKYLFGLGGGPVQAVQDALVDHPGIRYVISPHEGCVVAMADGYARASGKPAFVNVQATGGVFNALSPLYNAATDGVPLIVTSGEHALFSPRPTTASRFPVNHVDLVKPYTKWSWQVSRADRVAEALVRAVHIATSPPTGPVFLSIPSDVLEGGVSEIHIPPLDGRRLPPKLLAALEEVETAASLLLEAEKPLIIAGSQVTDARANADLVELAEMLAAPVIPEVSFYPAAFPARLAFPTDHPLSFRGLPRNHSFIGEADVVLTAGCREVPKRWFPLSGEGVKFIHLNSDPWNVANAFPVDAGIVADAKSGLSNLVQAVKRRMTAQNRESVQQRSRMVKTAKAELVVSLEGELSEGWDEVPIKPWRLVKDLSNALGEGTIVVDESVYSNCYMTTFFDFPDPTSYIGNSGCVLGWGLGAALGAKLARPEHRVVATLGDGSLLFGVQALWSAAKYDIPVIVVVFNNRSYGALKTHLVDFRGRALARGIFPGCDLGEPNIDFVQLARSFCLQGERVEHPDEIVPAVQRGVASNKPYLIDVSVCAKQSLRGVRLP